ncbi:hypothetical protein [Streptomyces sp. SBT349]|uniref:hypothetical protein n=1 Tax=Streptomyces sp. SBT349 TaxID=1580539 RepID=UPI00066CFFE5|nr:hypothetical protein [Streptomyces sp. SBT349]
MPKTPTPVTVAELMRLRRTLPGGAAIVLAGDPEGNCFFPLALDVNGRTGTVDPMTEGFRQGPTLRSPVPNGIPAEAVFAVFLYPRADRKGGAQSWTRWHTTRG